MTDDTDRQAMTLLEVAMEMPSDARHDYIAAQPDGPVKTRALDLLRHAPAAEYLMTGGAASSRLPHPLPDRIGAYRITALIGEGGMGAVYRGERAEGDFEHQVAIKVVRPGALSEALTDRFRRERRTLARLQHPNIARLFDGGETAEGASYIVMELIDGRSLARWIDEARPDAAARARLFQGVCAAVGFAHQNLIVHRDLTPSNILVTGDGVPKLIDFGIARPTAEIPEPASARGSEAMSLTAGYAAPERYEGTAATTLGDIYSLGMILDLLFPAPRDADVEAIVRMATAALPADRYPSADALADDVAAWRASMPVAARRGGRAYVARRFLQRHRMAVAASVVATILLAATFTATVLANRRAQAARIQADLRFDQTRSLAKVMMFDAFDEVSRVPGATRARATLAKASLAYLDALGADRGAPFALRVETGQGYARLADAIGSGQSAGLGRLAEGSALLAKAERLLRAALAEQPDDPEARRAYASLLLEKASVALYNDNDVASARAGAARAGSLVAPIARQSVEGARIYAGALQVQGDSHGWVDDWQRARPLHLAAERFVAALPPALAGARPVMMARSANLRLLGEANHKLHDEPAARAAIDQAVAINETLLAADPLDPQALRKVASSNWYSAVVHRTAGEQGAAATAIARAVAAAKKLRDADPADAASAHLWLIVSEVQAQILMDLGRRAEAFAVNDVLMASYRRLVDMSGDAPGMRRSYSSALRSIGEVFYNGADYGRACTAWRESSALLDWLEAKGALTDTDRNNGRVRVRHLLKSACDGGAPRPGMGKTI